MEGAFEKPVGILFTQLDHGTGLKQPHLFDNVQNQEGQFVNRIASYPSSRRPGNQSKIGIGSALFGGHSPL
jgi:hypothetical protein